MRRLDAWINAEQTCGVTACARSADFQSAVSRISNPLALRCSNTCRLAAVAPKRRYGAPRRRKVGDTADWKSALPGPYENFRRVCREIGVIQNKRSFLQACDPRSTGAEKCKTNTDRESSFRLNRQG